MSSNRYPQQKVCLLVLPGIQIYSVYEHSNGDEIQCYFLIQFTTITLYSMIKFCSLNFKVITHMFN